MATILDGRRVARELITQLAAQVAQCSTIPQLHIMLVGHDPASLAYVAQKQKVGAKVGIAVHLHQFANTTTAELVNAVTRLSRDPAVSGILVQLPLPHLIDTEAVLHAIAPSRDVDGVTFHSQGQLLRGVPQLVPATARGILTLLRAYNQPLAGQHAVIVGRSNLVGKPTALLLLQQNATVTLTHSHTTNLASLTRQADILVVAAGRPQMITAEYVKPGAVVVDVGISRTTDGLIGDVDHTSVAPIAGFLSPVPGGVGPLTVVCLMKNVLQAHQQRR